MLRHNYSFYWLLTAALVLSASPGVSWAADDTSDSALSNAVVTSAKTLEPPKQVLEEEKKPEIVVEEKEEEALKEEGPVFFVKKILLSGNEIFKDSELHPYLAPLENRQTNFGSLKAAARLVTNHYRSRGYVTSRAYIPPQKLENNDVEVRVAEGKFGEVYVEGNKYYDSEIYKKDFETLQGRTLRYQDIEDNLYFLNQRPDIRAKAYLIAGKEQTASDVILKTEEKYPIHIHYGFNNRGTKSTHRARHSATLTHNNLTGHGDRLGVGYNAATENAVVGGSLAYRFPIQQTGTTLEFDANVSSTRLIKHQKASEIEGQNINIVPGITQSIIKTPAFTFDWNAGFEIKDSKTSVVDLKISLDRLRILRSGPRFNWLDKGGRTILSGDIHWGLSDNFGGTGENDLNASRDNTDGNFMYYGVAAARLQRLPHSMYLINRADGQWSQDNLLSLEQFRAGGAFSVRGYPESDYSGDHGYHLSTELHIPASFIPDDWTVPFTKHKYKDTLQLVTFLDFARAYIREKRIDTTESSKSLMGTGFGIRLNLDENLAFQVDLGWPIGDDSTDKNNMQTHVSFTAGF